MAGGLVLAVAAAPVVVAGGATASGGSAAVRAVARTVVRLDDPRLTEVSSIAPRAAAGSTVFLANDSGADATVFAVDTATGRTRAVLSITGAEAVDWEDLAVAPDEAGRPSLWIADTGANAGARTELRLYRVPIPELPAYDGPSASAPVVRTAAAVVWRLTYPGGVTDTEALAVEPRTHRAYLTTKSALGRSTVYRVPERPDPARVQRAEAVGQVSLHTTGTPGGPVPPIGQVTVTGAALSAGGSVLVLRTYTDAYFWRVTDGDVATALKAAAIHLALPPQPQGEGVAIVGTELWLTTEGVGRPVLAVAVPAAVRSVLTATSSRSAPATPPPASSASTPGASAGSTPADGGDSNETTAWGLGAIIVIVALAWVLARRLRRKDQKRPEDHSWMG
jgi:hypothetical protein